MHIILTESARQRRRADAHKIKVVKPVHSRLQKSRTAGKIRKAARILRGERPFVSFNLEAYERPDPMPQWIVFDEITP